MKLQHISFCLCLLSAMTLTKVADADTNYGKKIPTTSEVIEALSSECVGKCRKIDMSGLEPAKNRTQTKQKSQFASKTGNEIAISMEILFGYKSVELTDAAKAQLNPVGEAFASEKLQHLDFVFEGHTDAIGGYAYNKSLSEKRAASVKQYLVDSFNINPSRVRIIGKGKMDLLDPANPDSEVNRRVRIIAIK